MVVEVLQHLRGGGIFFHLVLCLLLPSDGYDGNVASFLLLPLLTAYRLCALPDLRRCVFLCSILLRDLHLFEHQGRVMGKLWDHSKFAWAPMRDGEPRDAMLRVPNDSYGRWPLRAVQRAAMRCIVLAKTR